MVAKSGGCEQKYGIARSKCVLLNIGVIGAHSSSGIGADVVAMRGPRLVKAGDVTSSVASLVASHSILLLTGRECDAACSRPIGPFARRMYRSGVFSFQNTYPY